MSVARASSDAKSRFLAAAFKVIRKIGYQATTVDELCTQAGLSKGSFFHYFKTKEDLAVEAAQAWSAHANTVFSDAPFRHLADPRDRLLAYVDLRIAILTGPLADFTCLAGTMVQEVFDSNPRIREACAHAIHVHAASLEADIAAAIDLYGGHPQWTVKSLALYTQAVLQGAFVLAKAQNSPTIAAECLAHLRCYLELLFPSSPSKERSR